MGLLHVKINTIFYNKSKKGNQHSKKKNKKINLDENANGRSKSNYKQIVL